MAQRYLFLPFLFLLGAPVLQAQTAADYAVQLSATMQLSPAQITLHWKKLSGATGYQVSRKLKDEPFFNFLANLGANDSSYVDAAVSSDTVYEYQVVKSGGSIAATGYIAAAIRALPQHSRGYCILLVDTLFRDSCAAEVAQLMSDLRGDGWGVIRHNVRRDAAPASIRSLISTEYAARSGVKSLLLLGHVPVPYSGNLYPDGHTDHFGAWPADGYYADVNGTWSDASVNNSTASRSQNRNIPGDGKWDPSTLPSELELQTGRIDFANMPAIRRSEVQLMRNYLRKAHAYKIDSLPILKRAVVDDNFGAFSGEAFAANAWRAFPTVVGRTAIRAADFRATLMDSAFQWAYGCGAGGYSSCNGVGVTANFDTNAVRGVFTMLFGSYFGDWDATNSFLRAPLCAPEPALASCWAGRPNWFFHHMALGEPIGWSARLSQNNQGVYTPTNFAANSVHVALMGDPTLRSDYIAPAKNLTIVPAAGAGATLSWTASTDAGVAGYYVYRSDSAWGSYARVSGMLTGTTFRDSAGVSGKKFYLVRPVKLTQTPSGGYYNLGLGIGDSALVTYPAAGVPSIAKLSDLILRPLPASTGLTASIRYEGSPARAEVILTNITGSVLRREALSLKAGENTLSLDVSAFPAGLYIFELRTPGGVAARHWVKH